MSKHYPWKDLERRHAKRFRLGKRLWRPDFSDSQPDGESPRDTWDTKCYAKFSVIGKFVEAEKKYREFTAGRRFHLCLFDRSRPRAGDFVLVRAQEFADLVELERRINQLLSVPDVTEHKATRIISHRALREMLPDGCEYPDCAIPEGHAGSDFWMDGPDPADGFA